MKSNRAFTLIELLVVISIIALLASVVLSSLSAARDKGKLAAGKQFSANVFHAAGDYAMGSWDMSECSGTTVADRTGNSGSGTLTGAPVPAWSSTDTPSGQGCSLVFNGSNYVASIASTQLPVGTSPISAFAWMKTTMSSRASIFSYGTSISGQAVTLNVNQIAANGTFQMDFYSNVVDSNVVVNDGKWHYVGFTIPGGTNAITLYVDGAIARTTTIGVTPNIASGTNAQIGRWVTAGPGDVGTYGFNGSIDEVRVYSKTLTATEVQGLYAASAPRHDMASR